jgi:hypothetical protein
MLVVVVLISFVPIAIEFLRARRHKPDADYDSEATVQLPVVRPEQPPRR